MTKEGWATLCLAIIAYAGLAFASKNHGAAFDAGVIVETVMLVAVCYAKGETPRWQWGGED